MLSHLCRHHILDVLVRMELLIQVLLFKPNLHLLEPLIALSILELSMQLFLLGLLLTIDPLLLIKL
jgi:hypothetical protein